MSADLPIGWEWQPFENLLAIPLRNGIYKKKEFHGRGVKIVNMGELFAYPRLKDIDMKRVELTDKELNNSSLLCGDLIFARRSLTAEGAGKCTIVLEVNEPTTFESSIIRARLNSIKAVPEFFYYLFNSKFGKWLLGTILRQVAVAGITGSDLAKLKVPVPPIEDQHAIAKYGAMLDNKIELNRRINQTLEEMAQAIFKSWFVDFLPVRAKQHARTQTGEPVKAKIEARANGRDPERAAMGVISGKTSDELDQLPPDQLAQLRATAALFSNELTNSELGPIPQGWRWKALDQIADYQNGLALQKYRPEDENDYLPIVKIAQLKVGVATSKEKASPNINPACIIDNGDVVFSWSGSLMVDIWCGEKAALNQHLFKVTSEEYPKWFFYYWTKHHLAKFQQIAADKAVTMGHIKRSHLKEAMCAVPDFDIRKLHIMADLIDKQIAARLGSTLLAQLRNTLLPKLLSGEISVNHTQDTTLRRRYDL